MKSLKEFITERFISTNFEASEKIEGKRAFEYYMEKTYNIRMKGFGNFSFFNDSKDDCYFKYIPAKKTVVVENCNRIETK